MNLKDGSSKLPVLAQLEDGLSEASLGEIESQWGTLRREGNLRLIRTGREHLAHHGHWRWDHHRKLAGVRDGEYSIIGIRVGTEWQGAMSIHSRAAPAWNRPFWRRALNAAFPLLIRRPQTVYVDYLETGPWNYEPFVEPDPPRFRGVGAQLMAEAVRISMAMD